MSARSTEILAWVLGLFIVLGSSGFMLWLLRGWMTANSEANTRPMVDRQSAALQAFAGRVGGRYEPARTMDTWGRNVPVAGAVIFQCENLAAKLEYATSAWRGKAMSYVPQVTIDVPQGTRWVAQPTSGGWVRDPVLGWRLNEPGRISGETVQLYAESGRSAENFRKAFGVPEQSVPEKARQLLWSLTEQALDTRFTPERLTVGMRPPGFRPRLWQWQWMYKWEWEGTYDIDTMIEFVHQTCRLAAALLGQESGRFPQRFN